jgi:hypothetical protein
MSESKPDNRALLACADTELQGDRQTEVLRAMADDPQAVHTVLHQQQLRQAVCRSMEQMTPPTPAACHAQIAQMAGRQDKALSDINLRKDDVVGSINIRAVLRHWVPTALAAALLIGSFAILRVAIRTRDAARLEADAKVVAINNPNRHTDRGGSMLIDDTLLNRFASRHVSCSTMVDRLEQAAWPSEVAALPEALAVFLNTPTYAALDLSPIGYRYEGSGPCKLPGTQSVHLIYRANDDFRRDALSLWMCPDDNRFDIQEDKLHQVTSLQYPHPMYVWRHDGVIYYLMGDSDEYVRQATNQFVINN